MRSSRMSAGSSYAEFPQVCKEKEGLEDLQRCSPGRKSAVDQEESEPPQIKEEGEEPESPRIKEEQEELCTTQEDGQLDMKQENLAFLQPNFKPESEAMLGVAESDAVQSEEEMDEHKLASEITWRPSNLRKTNLQLPADTDAEVLADWQLSRIQEEKTPSPMKSDQDVGTSYESSQLNLKDEANTFMLTLSYEGGDSEPESETENRDHQESKLEEAPTNAELNPKKRQNRIGCFCAETPYLSEACHNNRASKKPLQTDSGTESLHYCKLCGKCFLKKCNLTAHLRTHTGEKPYTCDTCGKRFCQNSHLRVHMTTHTGERSYTCKMCEKTFSRNVNLLRHMRTHTGEKPYPCNTCGKRFSQSFDLLRHERSHTGEKPYPCTMCDKSFSQHSNLVYHMRTHTGEKPYLCVTCGKRFSQSSHVWRHMAVHGGGKSQR